MRLGRRGLALRRRGLRRGRRAGRRLVRRHGQRLELGAVEHAPLHLALDAQGRAVLEQPGRVDDPLAQRAQQRPEVVLAAVAEQRRARVDIDVPVVREHVQVLVDLQALDRPAIHPAGRRLAGQQILAAQVGLHRDHGPLFLRGQRSRRDCSPGRDHGRLGERLGVGVRDLLRLLRRDHVLGRQLLEHAVLHLVVAGVAPLVREPSPHQVQAREDPERLEEAVLVRARVLPAREPPVGQVDQKGPQRLRLVGRLREDVRQPVVREIDDGQAVLARGLGRRLTHDAPALDHRDRLLGRRLCRRRLLGRRLLRLRQHFGRRRLGRLFVLGRSGAACVICPPPASRPASARAIARITGAGARSADNWPVRKRLWGVRMGSSSTEGRA